MEKGNILKLILFFLPFISCSSEERIVCNSYNLIEVITLPHEMLTRSAIINAAVFDSSYKNQKDSTSFQPSLSFSLELGNELKDRDEIDIRTKVTLTNTCDSTFVLYLDKFGKILLDDKVYLGSEKQLNFFRNSD